MKDIKDYEPFGDEWIKEMKKLPKDFLIQMIKDANIRDKNLQESVIKNVLNKKPLLLYKCYLDEMQCSENCHNNLSLKEKCEFCKIELKTH